ncbi:hypothetical protein [Legionella feeleii]|uniref:Uncharacterized protein n=1 Tax=Legionella feeleii TaxID=453 RepID=A0A0W0THJ6_9GAMM|nr:hypothetical protein [Legionella feeleii]KTC94925.1 hypothetical protein Lfee_2589 [Legionella feeleii]SPX62011.1 Uncharacterised protein [Legionella feeleii]
MDLAKLETIIKNSGGSSFTLAGASELLIKINRLEKEKWFDKFLKQFQSSREQGDLRGRILEINFAYQFLEKNEQLQYENEQGMKGNVDFFWRFENFEICIEMKLKRQAIHIEEEFNRLIENNGSFPIEQDPLFENFKIREDIWEKSSIKKFSPNLKNNRLNFIGIDISELLHGTVDNLDCIIAANKILESKEIIEKQYIKNNNLHPCDYIHGVIFLFRRPKEKKALAYDLFSEIYINESLVNLVNKEKICNALYNIYPQFIPPTSSI